MPYKYHKSCNKPWLGHNVFAVAYSEYTPCFGEAVPHAKIPLPKFHLRNIHHWSSFRFMKHMDGLFYPMIHKLSYLLQLRQIISNQIRAGKIMSPMLKHWSCDSFTLSSWSADQIPEILDSELINTLRPTQNGRHFADNIFKRISLNENFWILNTFSLKYVP